MEIKKSVREFVEVVLKTGSLDNRFKTNARAIEGVRAHQKLQKSNEDIYNNYEKEVYLKTDICLEEFTLHLEGRCDGIIEENNHIIVEEIKSTYVPLIDIYDDFNPMHWSQGKLYAYMICKERNIDTISVQLSYYNLETDEVKSFLKKYSYNEITEYVNELIEYYKKYILVEIAHKEKRNNSIKNLKFPFNNYREGQLKFARACYGTIKEEKNIFIQAPTGIGKTISTIFPSVKAIGEGLGERLFYLTAKNVNKKVAEDTIEKLRDGGLIFNSVSLVAREKICINDEISCNKDDCPYANLYYDKIKTAIFEIIYEESFITTEKLIMYGKKYKICPFELSLDLIKWCDAVICDYNYIFDPKVYLRRIIDEEGDNNIILVDEAHNLVDRSRSNYSSTLNKSKFLELRRETRGIAPSLYRHANKINSIFIEEERICQSENKNSTYYNEVPKELNKHLRIFIREAEEVLTTREKSRFNDILLELYFEVNNFLSISEIYGDDYMTYIDINSEDMVISLFCVDPSSKIRKTMEKCRAVILFSATLSPFDYFIKVLGGNIEDYRLKLNSPFSKENLDVYLHRGNTRYSARKATLSDICDKTISFINDKVGNYMVFFPSYEYLKMAREYIESRYNNYKFIFQKSDMNENENKEFINKFNEEKNVIGLCVMGGMFSEGIDLPGDKLIGVVIIGVGYPKVCLENEIIKDYFKENGQNIAYIYPGINKVMQAGGRVIRRESDKGRILLIDDRYIKDEYYNLLPVEWKPLKNIKKK